MECGRGGWLEPLPCAAGNGNRGLDFADRQAGTAHPSVGRTSRFEVTLMGGESPVRTRQDLCVAARNRVGVRGTRVPQMVPRKPLEPLYCGLTGPPRAISGAPRREAFGVPSSGARTGGVVHAPTSTPTGEDRLKRGAQLVLDIWGSLTKVRQWHRNEGVARISSPVGFLTGPRTKVCKGSRSGPLIQSGAVVRKGRTRGAK